MEIRKYKDIVGVVATEAITDGRMVLLSENTVDSVDFGSRSDLPGVKLPSSSTEAARAKYCVTWPVSNEQFSGPIKLVISTPSFTWALRRGGWDQDSNLPMEDVDVYLTYPGNQEGNVIPSGWLALAFSEGVFTVPSGAFVESSNLKVAGAPLEVLNSGDDGASSAGKLAYNSGDASATVAIVEHYDTTANRLTFRTLGV